MNSYLRNALKLSFISSEITGKEVNTSAGPDIPWTISNKYYTADVHFHVQKPAKPPALPLYPPETAGEKVPAILFIWAKGEVSLYHLRLSKQHAHLHG
jgi:hypothetical protein